MMPASIPEVVVDAGDTSAALAAVAGLLVLLWVWVGRPIMREWKTNKAFQRQFRQDWLGEPERDGVPSRPGVMSRLSEMASDWTHLADRVRRAEKDILKLRGEVTFLLQSHKQRDLHVETITTDE